MTLKELFTNIANAIRSATGTTDTIKAADFAKKISAIIYRGVAVEGTDSGQNTHGVYYHIPSGYYNEDGTNSWVYRPLSDFGNAAASDVLSGKTFTSINGKEVKGTMTNNGSWSTTINPGGSVTIPAGYHNGGGKVSAGSASSALKTQTVTGRFSFTGSYYAATFTFNQLSSVEGIKSIYRANNGLRFCSYQVIKRNIGSDMNPFSISGNKVTLILEEQAEATTEADWTITAVGF